MSSLQALTSMDVTHNLLTAVPATLALIPSLVFSISQNCLTPAGAPAAVEARCLTIPGCTILPQGQTVGCDDPGTDRGALMDLYAALGGPGWRNSGGWNSSASSCTWVGVTCDGVFGTRVVRLSLWYNYMQGALPASIGTMTYLTSLDLSSNTISGSLPSSICALVSLRSLNLAYNAFTGPLPACFGTLTRLTSVDVSYNTFTGLVPPGVAALTALTNLQVSECE